MRSRPGGRTCGWTTSASPSTTGPSTSTTSSPTPGSCGGARATSSSSTPRRSRRTCSGSATGSATSATSRPISENGPTQRLLSPARRTAVVPRRRHLRGPRPGLRRLRRRWDRRLPGPDLQAGLPPGPRGDCPVAPAVLPLAAAGRRLRHLVVPGGQPVLRDAPGLPGAPARGPRTRAVRDHRAGPQPHLGPAPLVPAGQEVAPRQPGAGLLRVERHPRALPGRPGHLPGLRAVELVVGPRGRRVLLAPVLRPPARPQLRQPRGPPGHVRRRGLLAGDGGRRAAPGRGPLPVRTGRHELREPPGDVRLPAGPPPAHRRPVPEPDAAGRGQPVAGGRGRVL